MQHKYMQFNTLCGEGLQQCKYIWIIWCFHLCCFSTNVTITKAITVNTSMTNAFECSQLLLTLTRWCDFDTKAKCGWPDLDTGSTNLYSLSVCKQTEIHTNIDSNCYADSETVLGMYMCNEHCNSSACTLSNCLLVIVIITSAHNVINVCLMPS